jgi:hypothetical protein
MDGVLNRLTGAADGMSGGGAANRDDPEIRIRTQARVQLHLFTAVVVAPGEGTEVEEAEVYRLLDLVDMITGKQHVGDVSLE